MNWSDIAKSVASYAPQIATVLAATGVGAPAAAAVAAAGALISNSLGVPNTPDDVGQALVSNPDAAVKIKQIEAEHGENLAKIAADSQAAATNAQVSQLQTINETMRKEDETRAFSWRDYWGYISGTAFAFVVLVVIYLVEEAVRTDKPILLQSIAPIVGAFTTLFGIAATVLGVQSSIETHHDGMAKRGQ